MSTYLDKFRMKFFKKKQQIKQLIPQSMNIGCMASNRITVDGARVGYMYREENDSQYPDSGWTFFAGDEDEEYTANADNFHVFELNTICNYDPSIIPYLNLPYGIALIRNGEDFEMENLEPMG